MSRPYIRKLTLIEEILKESKKFTDDQDNNDISKQVKELTNKERNSIEQYLSSKDKLTTDEKQLLQEITNQKEEVSLKNNTKEITKESDQELLDKYTDDVKERIDNLELEERNKIEDELLEKESLTTKETLLLHELRNKKSSEKALDKKMAIAFAIALVIIAILGIPTFLG